MLSPRKIGSKSLDGIIAEPARAPKLSRRRTTGAFGHRSTVPGPRAAVIAPMPRAAGA